MPNAVAAQTTDVEQQIIDALFASKEVSITLNSGRHLDNVIIKLPALSQGKFIVTITSTEIISISDVARFESGDRILTH